jgi:hypothetical protein
MKLPHTEPCRTRRRRASPPPRKLQGPPGVPDVPPDAYAKVFALLPRKQRASCAAVCRAWRWGAALFATKLKNIPAAQLDGALRAHPNITHVSLNHRNEDAAAAVQTARAAGVVAGRARKLADPERALAVALAAAAHSGRRLEALKLVGYPGALTRLLEAVTRPPARGAPAAPFGLLRALHFSNPHEPQPRRRGGRPAEEERRGGMAAGHLYALGKRLPSLVSLTIDNPQLESAGLNDPPFPLRSFAALTVLRLCRLRRPVPARMVQSVPALRRLVLEDFQGIEEVMECGAATRQVVPSIKVGVVETGSALQLRSEKAVLDSSTPPVFLKSILQPLRITRHRRISRSSTAPGPTP